MSCETLGEIAQAMLDGTLNYLLGAEKLVDLREGLGIYANDPDFVVFIAVKSELNSLRDEGVDPAGGDFCSLVELNKIKDSVNWAREVSLAQCQSLVNRYGH